jgi:tRNA(Glu) U13 pseudouridine synthase TruD
VLALTFSLPPGSFAAAVLREVMKPGVQSGGAAPGADQSDSVAEADSEG